MQQKMEHLAETILENKFSPAIEKYIALSVLHKQNNNQEDLAEIAPAIIEGSKYTSAGKELVRLLLG